MEAKPSTTLYRTCLLWTNGRVYYYHPSRDPLFPTEYLAFWKQWRQRTPELRHIIMGRASLKWSGMSRVAGALVSDRQVGIRHGGRHRAHSWRLNQNIANRRWEGALWTSHAMIHPRYRNITISVFVQKYKSTNSTWLDFSALVKCQCEMYY